jgi:hypothetical protein
VTINYDDTQILYTININDQIVFDPKQLEIKIVKNEKNMTIHIGEPEINSYYIKIKRDCILYGMYGIQSGR